MDSEGEDGDEEELAGTGGRSGGNAKSTRAVLAMATKFLPLYEVKSGAGGGEHGGGDGVLLSLPRGKEGGRGRRQQQEEDEERDDDDDDDES